MNYKVNNDGDNCFLGKTAFSLKPISLVEYEQKRKQAIEHAERMKCATESIENLNSGELYKISKIATQKANQKRRENLGDSYKPKKRFNYEFGEMAIQLVLNGYTKEKAILECGTKFGLSDEFVEEARKQDYYDTIKVIKYHDKAISKLCKRKVLKKVNLKQNRKLVGVLDDLERAITMMSELKKLRKENKELKKTNTLIRKNSTDIRSVEPSTMTKPELIELAKGMKQSGFTYDQIATKVDKTEKTIRNWLRNL